MGPGLEKRAGRVSAWELGWPSQVGWPCPFTCLFPRSAADSASGAGDGPGPRAGVPRPAVASALGGGGSPGLRAHG